MIVDAILDIVFGAVGWFVALLPSTPSFDCTALAGAGSYLAWVDRFIDLPALAGVLSVMLTIEGTVLVFKGVVWLWHQVPVPK